MADFRQLGISGLTSRRFMNLRPVARIASRYGRTYSGAYDRAAAQYASPVMARLKMLGRERRMGTMYQDWMRKEQQKRMLGQRQMMGLQMAGGVAGDLAGWLKQRQLEPGKISPELSRMRPTEFELLTRYMRGEPIGKFMQRHKLSFDDLRRIAAPYDTGFGEIEEIAGQHGMRLGDLQRVRTSRPLPSGGRY